MPPIVKYAIGGAVIFILLLISWPFVEVGPGARGVLMDFGSVQPGVLKPGLHLVVPIMQNVHQMDVRVQKYVGNEEASSLDLQDVHTQIAVNYHITPVDANWLFQTVGDLQAVDGKIVQPAIDNAVKAATAHFNAEELIAKRDQVALEINNLLRTALQPYRLIVDAVNITNFSFSPEFSAAIEKKQVAQQQALQAKYELDQQTVFVQQQVVQARAAATAKIAAATGDARARVLNAQATAKANDLIQQTLTPGVLRLRAIDRWNGILPAYLGAAAPLPFLNAPAAAAH